LTTGDPKSYRASTDPVRVDPAMGSTLVSAASTRNPAGGRWQPETSREHNSGSEPEQHQTGDQASHAVRHRSCPFLEFCQKGERPAQPHDVSADEEAAMSTVLRAVANNRAARDPSCPFPFNLCLSNHQQLASQSLSR
jgi:hypothetical protein